MGVRPRVTKVILGRPLQSSPSAELNNQPLANSATATSDHVRTALVGFRAWVPVAAPGRYLAA